MDVSESLATGLGAVGNETALPEAAFAELLRLASQDAVTDERAGTRSSGRLLHTAPAPAPPTTTDRRTQAKGAGRTPFDGRPDLAQAKGLASVNAATVKEAHAALLGFILEAARFDVDPAAVGYDPPAAAPPARKRGRTLALTRPHHAPLSRALNVLAVRAVRRRTAPCSRRTSSPPGAPRLWRRRTRRCGPPCVRS